MLEMAQEATTARKERANVEVILCQQNEKIKEMHAMLKKLVKDKDENGSKKGSVET